MTAILDAYGRPIVARQPKRRVRASYDAAADTTRNERHWANADGRSASAATSHEVREKLRRRARYACHESNSYAAGIVRTLANDIIGTGPRLQLMIPGRSDAARRIEREFMLWSYEARLAEKLRSMTIAKVVDGEAFAAFVTNPGLQTPVQLDLALIECDRVKSPWWQLDETEENADGILFDSYGNPRQYTVLQEHPGNDFLTEFGEFDTIDAADMIHLFRLDRPGQRRGVPEIAPALPLFALLQRFTLATLHAAETAASYSGVLFTDDPDNDDESVDAEPGDVIEVEHNSLLVLPNGRKLGQMKAEHPTTNHEMFKRETLREALRCMTMPYNIGSGDSSKYNYASGRLDHQTYDRRIKIDQDYTGAACLDRTFVRWFDEASLIPDRRNRDGSREAYIPDGLPPMAEWNWLWFFDGRPHVDPLKEAAAATTLVNGLLLTEKAYFAERGLDSEEQERQIALEMGLSVPELRKLKAVKRFVSGAAQEAMVREILEMDAAEEAAQERESAREEAAGAA